MENSQKQFAVDSNLLASQGQRFLHYVIDNIMVYIIILGVLFIISLLCGFFGAFGFSNWVAGLTDMGWYAIYYSAMIIYYALFEYFFSRTIAKYITGTIVVTKNGAKPDFVTIFKRTLCRIIPFEQFSFLGGNNRGWHDTIMDVYVVRKNDFEENRNLFHSFEEIGKTEE